ncbi:hypothetical protein BYT27DRAFT_6498226 [Phlegmacium glaucopus]|nr:hypothetical protein BYT27DRAFT_6552322 [Phlegmacium glaucopus]KAF8810366.1 hypothetical protein BYT27DRAFT_6498226 [Phlegmacium glaucopus]
MPCNRPSDTSTPTKDDNKFANELIKAMTQIYTLETGRQNAVTKIFNDNGIFIKGTKISSYTTVGDISVGPYRHLIAEFKNEVGSPGAEPYLQTLLYYLEATREQAADHPNSVLPCIILLIFGPYIAFAGAAWTGRPNLQMLSTVIPCHFHSSDTETRDMLARHIGALKRSLLGLETYYKKTLSSLPSLPSVSPRNPTVPYPCSFIHDSSKKHFIYLSRLENNNPFFFGRMDGDDDGSICIKFVTRYCKEAHEFCASKGFAPRLHAVERLPGGWHMVVMDDMGDDYVSLDDFIETTQENADTRNTFLGKFRECLSQLHQAGYVHGDVRNTNILLRKSDHDFKLLDFDWSGRIGEVKYPFNINTTTVKRPDEVTDGGLIQEKHDMEMLDYIW